jgi:mannose-6-phosphate isomerase
MNIHKMEKPWGHDERFTFNEFSTVKIITVEIGGKLSLQTHENREEFWRILQGHPVITIGDNRIEAVPDDSFMIKAGEKHRIEAPTDKVMLLEISFGAFDEEDIIRLEDAYGRAHV